MKWLRNNIIRLVLLAFFSLLALGYGFNAVFFGHQVQTHFPDLLPRLSPLLNLGGAIATRRFLGWAMLLGIPLLILPFFKGRFFCWKICPMGFLAETASRINPNKTLIWKIPYINRWLTLVLVVTAICGYPLIIWLDPLCIFNGFFVTWRQPLTWVTATTGIGFVTILLLSVAVPNIWCHRLCPLGGLEEALTIFAQRIKQRASKTEKPEAVVSRRTVLAALPAGLAGIAGSLCGAANAGTVIRPPSADQVRFNAVCARCGNCMRACPYGLLVPDLGESGIDGLFTPVMHFRSKNPDQEDFCFHDCTKCSEVCPTGALKPLTVEQKHATPIGVAEINRNLCIAWAKGEYCAVCDEYCPYKAVQLEKNGEVNCPIVNTDLCRGCGACESQCPAQPIAIRVQPLKKPPV